MNWIKIDFEAVTPYGLFRDAILLQEDHTLTPDEIEAIKQARVQNWVAVIEAASKNELELSVPSEGVDG
jgi:hypothetical protein